MNYISSYSENHSVCETRFRRGSPFVPRSRDPRGLVARRLGVYPIWENSLRSPDRRSRVGHSTRPKSGCSRGGSSSLFFRSCEGEDLPSHPLSQSTAYLPAKQRARDANDSPLLLFQIHPFEPALVRRLAHLKYSAGTKTVSFPSQSIFARPTHSRL